MTAAVLFPVTVFEQSISKGFDGKGRLRQNSRGGHEYVQGLEHILIIFIDNK